MTLGASMEGRSDRSVLGRSERWRTIRPFSGSARPVVFAATLIGLLELVLFRVLAPVMSHIPIGPGGSLAEAVRASGASALRGTALLAPVAAVALGAVLWKAKQPVPAVLLSGSVALVFGASIEAASALSLAAHAATVAAAAALVAVATNEMSRWHAFGVGLLALSFVAGKWPLVLDSLFASGVGAGDVFTTGSRTVAEAALAIAPLALAGGLVRGGVRTRWAWATAAVSGLVVAVAIAVAPAHLAITTLWASGVTLSLPPAVYIAAASALGLVVGEWASRESSRHLVAGVALLAVAGVAPALMHHNLTALAGLALLALPALPRAVPAPAGTGG